MDEYTKGDAPYTDTRDLRTMLGLRVLTKSGKRVGRVKEVRIDEKADFAGIAVTRFLRRRYIGASYIAEMREKAIILKMTPVHLYHNYPVLSSDGKRLGKVIAVERQGTSEKISAFQVRRLFRTYRIPITSVKDLQSAVILDKTYDEAKSFT